MHRVLLLGDQLLGDFNEAMKLTIEAAELAGISFQSRILDLTHRQQMRFPQIVSQALTIFFRDPDRSGWVELNATILQFRSLHSKLLLGGFPEEEHLHSSNFTLRKVGDVCIVRQMARIMVYYDEMEQLVYQVAHATLEPSGLQRLLELNVLGMDAMEVCSHELEEYYDGEHHGCENQSLAVDEWLVLIEEVAGLTGFGQDVVSELVLSQQTNPLVSRLDATIAQLTSSSQRILVGSARPLVPVQPPSSVGTLFSPLLFSYIGFPQVLQLEKDQPSLEGLLPVFSPASLTWNRWCWRWRRLLVQRTCRKRSPKAKFSTPKLKTPAQVTLPT